MPSNENHSSPIEETLTEITQTHVETVEASVTEAPKQNPHAETLSSILRSATVHTQPELPSEISSDEHAKLDIETTTTAPFASISHQVETVDEVVVSALKNESELETEHVTFVKNPTLKHSLPSKFCADITSIRALFSDHIEPIYHPVISLLPDDLQLILLDETSFGGLRAASCLLLAFFLGSISLVWFALLKKKENQRINHIRGLKEQQLVLNNTIKRITFERETFEAKFEELSEKYAF